MKIDVPPFVWISVSTVILVTVVAYLARMAEDGSAFTTSGRANASAKQFIDSAVRSACRAEQDVKPVQQLSDAQFGLAYINCGRLLAGSDATLETLTSTRISELHIALKTLQRDALAKIGKLCPALSATQTFT